VKEEFVRIPPQQTWMAWSIDLLIKKPIAWTFKKFKDSVLNNTKAVSEDTLYVHIGACKVGGMSILAAFSQNFKEEDNSSETQ
jgi:hypothetical protein